MLITLLSFICLLFQIVIAVESDSSAQQFIETIYANYSNENSSFAYNGSSADTIFSPSLLTLIRLDQKNACGEVGYLDFDPICGCQDDDGMKFQIKMTKVMDTRAYSKVSLTFPTAHKNMIVKLTTINNNWRIADIVDSSLAIPSLFEFLKKSLNISDLELDLQGKWSELSQHKMSLQVNGDTLYYPQASQKLFFKINKREIISFGNKDDTGFIARIIKVDKDSLLLKNKKTDKISRFIRFYDN